MAIVYLAEDLRHRRKVALKVLRPELAGVLAVERFLREIRIAGALDHPRIVSLLDSGESDGIPWYVMPWASGSSLRERIARERQLPIPEVLQIARDVADALTYAHGNDILHRDIKPDNILFDGGRAVVTDFGIARAIVNATPEERLTASGITVGTPPYMSPEQSAGDSNMDARSDVYALGCVVYEMLAGQPPFTGTTASAIRARHQLDPVPSLRTVRSTIPRGLEHVVVRALAKVPADRYATAEEFAAALESPPFVPEEKALPRRVRVSTLAAAAVLVVGTVVAGQVMWPSRGALEPERVLIYPMVERGLSPGDSGVGYDVALMLGAALEHTEPLKWLDGWQYLDARGRADARLVSARTARRIAEDRLARYYIDGIVRQDSDSVSVTLRLHDAEGDSVVAQQTAAGVVGRSQAFQLGLDAVSALLPRLLAAERRVDFAPLADRRPAAIALWLQGEREYRLGRFEPALRLYERAVAEDSALVFAAVKGAQAANWLQLLKPSRQLLAVALAGESRLPPRYRDFARGLDAYFAGRADSAVSYLERSLAAAPQWEEAAMALGDVYYHLLPARAPLDSLARAAFEAAVDADTLFTPALLHLVEIAARDGDVRRARRFMQRLRAGQPDTTLMRQLELMVSCVDRGAARFDWMLGDGNPVAMLVAAKGLAVAGSQPDCAEAGFRALLTMPGAAAGQRWAALNGLQGLLAARGRISELTSLLDSAAASGTSQAIWLYVLDAEAGLAVHRQSAQLETMARQRFGDKFAGASPHVLWMLAQHFSRLGDLSQVQALHESLGRLRSEPGLRIARLLTDAVGADLAVAQRDTAAAISKLRALAVTGTVDTLTWSLWEPLAVERLKLARLLIGRGQYAEAVSVASTFDHQQPVAFLPFIPASLEIRVVAARAMGDAARAAVYVRRLERLGRRDLVAVK